jgi:hypothetical protein
VGIVGVVLFLGLVSSAVFGSLANWLLKCARGYKYFNVLWFILLSFVLLWLFAGICYLINSPWHSEGKCDFGGLEWIIRIPVLSLFFLPAIPVCVIVLLKNPFRRLANHPNKTDFD